MISTMLPALVDSIFYEDKDNVVKVTNIVTEKRIFEYMGYVWYEGITIKHFFKDYKEIEIFENNGENK